MLELKFKKPVYEDANGVKGPVDTHEFREGQNTTIRKGTKWDIKPFGVTQKGVSSLVRLIDADNGEKIGIGYITDTYSKPFNQLKSMDLACEHDANLTDLRELYKRMVSLYRNFRKNSIVTIVNFNYHYDKETVGE